MNGGSRVPRYTHKRYGASSVSSELRISVRPSEGLAGGPRSVRRRFGTSPVVSGAHKCKHAALARDDIAYRAHARDEADDQREHRRDDGDPQGHPHRSPRPFLRERPAFLNG